MIQANELRIGNIVNENMKVVGIMYQYGSYDYDIHVQKIGTLFIYKFSEEQIRPIPLTPEILEKCGFHKYSRSEASDGFEIYWGNGNWFRGFLNPSDAFCLLNCEMSHRKIEYLHQFQNLCYDLTGKELEIKF